MRRASIIADRPQPGTPLGRIAATAGPLADPWAADPPPPRRGFRCPDPSSCVSQFAPAGDQPEAIRRLVEGLRRRRGGHDPAGRHRLRQDLHHRQRHRGASASGPDPGPQQDPGRPALRGDARVLPAQRGRVFRLLLRLLPAGGLCPGHATPISRRTPRSTSTSSRCACRPPRPCWSARTSSSSRPSPPSTAWAIRTPISRWSCISTAAT